MLYFVWSLRWVGNACCQWRLRELHALPWPSKPCFFLKIKKPWPSNPCFFFSISLLVFVFRFPCFLEVFSFLFQGFRGSAKSKKNLFFSGFPLLFFPPKKQGLEGQGKGNAPKKNKGSSSLCGTLTILGSGKKGRTHKQIKQGKSENEKSKEIEKARIGGSGCWDPNLHPKNLFNF